MSENKLSYLQRFKYFVEQEKKVPILSLSEELAQLDRKNNYVTDRGIVTDTGRYNPQNLETVFPDRDGPPCILL